MVGGVERPVAYLSKAFNDMEQKWSTIEHETFAVVYAAVQWEHMLLGHPWILETDHKNILWLEKATAPKLVRWRLRLQEHNYKVHHIPGKDNVVADALSWCLSCLHGAVVPGTPQVLLMSEAPSEDMIKEIEKFHSELVGHRGIQATERLMHEAGHNGKGLRSAIEWYVRNCPMCQKTQLGQGRMAASLATIKVSIDTIGPLPEDIDGYKYMIMAVDSMSTFLEAELALRVAAEDAAQFILKLCGRYGVPCSIRSDNGPQYAAQLIECLLLLLGAARHSSLEYHPESNGIVERCNAKIMQHFRAIICDRRLQKEWSRYVPMAMRIVNGTASTSTGMPAARIMFGDAVDID